MIGRILLYGDYGPLKLKAIFVGKMLPKMLVEGRRLVSMIVFSLELVSYSQLILPISEQFN